MGKRILILTALMMLLAGAKADTITLFYEEPCLTCDDGSLLSEIITQLEGLYDPYKAQILGINAFSHREALEDAAHRAGVKVSSLALPAVFFPDGTVIAGAEDIALNLRSAYISYTGAENAGGQAPLPSSVKTHAPEGDCATAGLNASGESGFLWYLCAPNCESCHSVRPMIDEAAARGVAPRQVNCVTDSETAQKLFRLYAVPEDRRFAPCVLVGDRAFTGLEEISASLEDALARGLAESTKELPSRNLALPLGGAATILFIGVILIMRRFAKHGR